MAESKHKPIHPGEVLAEEFLGPLGLSIYGLAGAIGVSRQQVGRIIRGERGVSADMALRLARFFGTTPEFWVNLQARYDLEMAKDTSGQQIKQRVKPFKAA